MSGYEIGGTVLAISHTEEGNPAPGEKRKLFIFGEGVYVGDKPRPGTTWPCSAGDYELIATVVTQNDHLPIEEHPFVQFYDTAVENAGPDSPPKRDREEMIAGLLAEREVPLDDRVRKLYEASCENPCIYLDNGSIAWGFMCWWGPADRADHKFPKSHFEYVEVPVPEVYGRWRD